MATGAVPEDNSIIFFPSRCCHSVIPIQCPSPDFGDNRFVIDGHISSRAEADGDASVQGLVGGEARFLHDPAHWTLTRVSRESDGQPV